MSKREYSNEKFDVSVYMEECLPDWATYYVGNCDEVDRYVSGAQLCTRDGRRVGNAVIISMGKADFKHWNPSEGITMFEVLTDVGTNFTMTLEELKEMFYSPIYLMDVEEAENLRRKKDSDFFN